MKKLVLLLCLFVGCSNDTTTIEKKTNEANTYTLKVKGSCRNYTIREFLGEEDYLLIESGNGFTIIPKKPNWEEDQKCPKCGK